MNHSDMVNQRSLSLVKHGLGNVTRKLVGIAGYGLVRLQENTLYPPNTDSPTKAIIDQVRPYTYTSPRRIRALCHAIDYLVTNDIRGPLVECGVWRGGSIMAAALRLLSHGVNDRDFFLYDTFDGMSPPSWRDRRCGDGLSAQDWLSDQDARATIAEVKYNLLRTGYPMERFHIVMGEVEKSLPHSLPIDQIALLRLDTDWYESTLHELRHAYPKLIQSGVLIVDDYNDWEGATLAVDEFFSVPTGGGAPLLLRMDCDQGLIGIRN